MRNIFIAFLIAFFGLMLLACEDEGDRLRRRHEYEHTIDRRNPIPGSPYHACGFPTPAERNPFLDTPCLCRGSDSDYHPKVVRRFYQSWGVGGEYRESHGFPRDGWLITCGDIEPGDDERN